MNPTPDPPKTTTVQPLISPGKALLLSFMLPGLGQLFTGRIKRGFIMTVGMFGWIIWATVTMIMDFKKVMPELLDQASEAGQSGLSLVDIQQSMALQTGATALAWLFLPLIVIWVWSIADSIRYFLEVKRLSP